MITYWVKATPENANLLGSPAFASNFISNEEGVLVVTREGTFQGINGPFHDEYRQDIIKCIPEYKYHEKTKQFIPANSKLFEEQEKSSVKAPDFKIEVGDIVRVSPDSATTDIAGSDVEVLGTFTFKETKYTTVGTETMCYMVKQSELFPPFTEHEKRVQQVIRENFENIIKLTKFNVTQEELAEFLISKQNNQETK